MQQVEFENLLTHAMGYDATSIGSAVAEQALKSRIAKWPPTGKLPPGGKCSDKHVGNSRHGRQQQ